jgi:hypothetical protein
MLKAPTWAAAVVIAAAVPVIAHDPITTKVTWDREIAPIFQSRCVSCHAPGGPAPMPLTTYAEARPWVRAIREEVLARRMPKWAVVRGYGDFTNDPSLSAFEIALITAWVDGGAPRSVAPLRGSSSPSSSVSTPLRQTPRVDLPAGSREIVVPCRSHALPDGRLVAIRPALVAGADLRLTLESRDGTREPLLWIRNFDPRLSPIYRLRRPATRTGARLAVVPPTGNCELALSITGL